MKDIFKKLDIKFIVTNIITFVAMVILLSSVGFLIGVTINYLTIPFAALLSGLVTSRIFKENKNKLLNVFASYIVVGITVIISLMFYDLTWDGNVYHKQLIGLLKNGVNPMYNKLSGDIWAQHYANGTEVFAGGMYAFTNNIEAGKCINLLLALGVMYFAYDLIKDLKFNKVFKVLFSFALAFNPLILNQFCSYYIDGVVANSNFLVIISLLLFIKNDYKFDNKISLLFITSSIIAVNAKFTSLLIWGLYFGVLGLFIFINRIKNKEYKDLGKYIIVGFTSVILSVVVCGSSTYIKNFADHGHPFYPLMGEGAVDIESDNEPRSFKNYSHSKKWLYATFSRTYTWYDINPQLKVPFSVHKSEMESIYYPDIRIGGLGIWYSGILCLSLLGLLISMPILFVKNKKYFMIILALIIATFGPIPKLPIVWQARYYPELYLVGFIAVISLVLANKKLCKYFA